MKTKSYLFAAAIAAMSLAGCAKDDVNNDQGSNGPGGLSGDGYMSIAFSFPEETRANGEFENGEGAESLIKTIDVYFFDETKSLIGHTPATPGFEGDGNDDGVEKTVDVEVPAELVSYLKGDATKKAGIIVVVNKGNVSIPNTPAITYAAFNAALAASTADVTSAADGFLMTSTNYLDASEEEAALTEITSANIGTRSNGGATAPEKIVDVAVERVAAKVTVKAGAGVDIKAWGLNVTNTKFFPVKELAAGFVDAFATKYAEWPLKTDNKWNDASHFRSYWAVDPNYASGSVLIDGDDNFKKLDLSAAGTTTEAGESLYCLENTFDEAMQRMPATTTAVIVAQFVPDTDIDGSANGDNTWVNWKNHNFYAADFVNRIVTEAQDVIQTYYYRTDNTVDPSDEKPYTYVQLGSKHFGIGVAEGTDPIMIGDQIVGYNGSATVVLDKKLLEGDIESGKLYTKVGEGDKPEDWQEADNAGKVIAEAIANVIGDKAKVYVNGYCYYEVPIRHFDNKEVPWSTTDVVNQEKHLGRYGIVRNNSYELVVNSIKTPGKPITGNEITPEEGPDDKIEYYLDVDIKVLSWAIRRQIVEL